MEDRVTLNYIYISLLSALFAIVLTVAAFFSSYQNQVADDLADQALLIQSAYAQMEAPEELELFSVTQEDIQLFSATGELLYSSAETEAIPFSVLDSVLEDDAWSSEKYAAGSGTKLLYSAVRQEDGTVLCVSCPAPAVFQIFFQSFGYIILIFLILVPLSFLFSLLMTRHLLKPIKELPRLLAQPNFDPAQAKLYPELVPLIQEITERRNEREAMRQEFTANVSHELKTPLTTISGYSEMIANGLAKPEDIPRFAAKIHAESERMQTLVGDIIELNALDSEVEHQHEEAVDIQALVQDCVEQLAPHFAAKHLSVYMTGEGFTVQGNRRQLWELVYNLLDNARRYNVDGGMIRVQVSDRVLSVRDTGIGIPEAHQSRVFERFYRVDKSHSRATGGTGLGLSIVKHVAELHGATVELESKEHIGTEIRVRFPS